MNPTTHVAIGSCRDVAEAALVRAVLTAHEIPVHISGGNAASLGLGSSAVEQRIWVPRAQADEAAALLAEMREGGAHALADDEVPADDTAAREEVVTDDGAVVAPVDGGPDGSADTLSRLRRRDRVALATAAGVSPRPGSSSSASGRW